MNLRNGNVKSFKRNFEQIDIYSALNSAFEVFRAKGYERTSLSDLASVMGISRPILYAIFGSKEALFRRVLDLNGRRTLDYIIEACHKISARAVAESLLYGAVDAAMSGEGLGCIEVNTSVTYRIAQSPVASHINQRRNLVKKIIEGRMERAIQEGDIIQDIKPSAISNYLLSLM